MSSQHLLMDRKWERHFDNQTLARSLSYANSNTISEVLFELQDFDQTLVIYAYVKGSSLGRYRTRIELDLDKGDHIFGDFSCSCPVGERCKHSAAVLGYLADCLSREVPTSPPGMMAPHLKDWLQKIEAAAKTSSPSAANKAKDSRFLVCCLEDPGHSYRKGYEIALRVGSLLKMDPFPSRIPWQMQIPPECRSI
ncbi:MAG: hypothetical protein HC767_10020 [Akkermansiaceae bacterium]|nr:hypothetical protein [Akkermansiaceae bacterium]